MKTLYLDCSMGAAGDMLSAALLELLPDPDSFVKNLSALGLPGVSFRRERAVRCGITGTRLRVLVAGEEEGPPKPPAPPQGGPRPQTPPCEPHPQLPVPPKHTMGAEQPGEPHTKPPAPPQEAPRPEALPGHYGPGSNAPGALHGHVQGAAEHRHSTMHTVRHFVENVDLPKRVKQDILAVYDLLAQAESHVHGVPVADIHFHEIGTMDALADITACCLLMHTLSPDEVVASPVCVGSGQVECAHGILPVPAPATAYILREVPIYGSDIQAELCTPTGAALLKHFVNRFGPMPLVRTQAIGYGMGSREFRAANCVRALLGESEGVTDVILELSCNVDDMTAEEIAFATQQLFENGAQDVYTVPIGMKKSRPATLIRVLCQEAERDHMLALLFRYTSTLGVREVRSQRYILDRRVETVQTPYGAVRRKEAWGYGVSRAKYEYEDLARIARQNKLSLQEVKMCLADAPGADTAIAPQSSTEPTTEEGERQ